MKQRNIKLVIEYDGTNYRGWQSQNGHHKTVQETITTAIKKVTGEKVILYGASRTDSGVHAVGQVANFFSQTELSPRRLILAINTNLPDDIVIKQAKIVPQDFNARYAAKSKTYLYTINKGKTPSALKRHLVYYIGGRRLDLKKMKKAARYLIGEHNFRSFATDASTRINYIRQIYALNISQDREFIYIKIKGSGFVYNMVRTIVGTLLMVGQGKIPPDEVKKILDSHDRRKAGPNISAKGLCLLKVEY